MAVVDERAADVEAPAGPHLNELIEARISRRTVIAGGMAAVAGFMAGGVGSAAAHGRGKGHARLLGFEPVPLSFGDEVVVPRGYTARPFIPWGTPILGGYPEFRPGQNTAAEQAQQIGMHHDGMHYFPLGKGPHGSRRGLLVLNHEYTDERYLHTGTTTMPPVSSWTLEMVRKSQNAHGVAVVEIARGRRGAWEVVRSKYNRRITANRWAPSTTARTATRRGPRT
jgi:secreted PhoX family phosphatase